MKAVFMGTPDFAVPPLKALIEKHEVVAVISQPDKPKGRGKHLMPTPVKEVALENNIPVYQPEKIKAEDAVELVKSFNADVIVVVAYGQILPESILNAPKYGCINVHGSLLPKYRGAAPIQWAVIDGEPTSGVTIMYMEKGLDCGDMILKREIPIEPEDTYGTLYDKISELGADALIEALTLLENGTASPQKQDDSLSTYAVKIEKEMGLVDWSKTSTEIVNHIRGFNPMPGAFTNYGDEVFKLWMAESVDGEYNGAVGEIADVTKKGFVVKCGDGAVLVTIMQAKGGKRMATADYMRGHSIEKGTVLR
jgi:methionyl-tRNA formyltransferase